MSLYQYFILGFSILVIYELIFSVLIRPYYVKKLTSEDIKKINLPEVSIEAFILLGIIFGLAVGHAAKMEPFVFLGAIFLVYGIASFNSKFSFYLASGLLFDFYRNYSYKDQMRKQKFITTYIFFVLSVLFFFFAFYLPVL